MADEWGPWIAHDNSVKPVSSGQYVRAEFSKDINHSKNMPWKLVNNRTAEWIVGDNDNWHDDGYCYCRILRYRIRRPKALQQLIDMVENLPVDERIKEDA